MTGALFPEYRYMDYVFPQPQYLGAKYRFRSWIGSFLPSGASSVLDAFGGSQSISYYFKQLGLRVATNDFLKFNYWIGKALIENPSEKLDDSDVELLFSENPAPETYNLMEGLFADLFFPREDARFADSVRGNIEQLSSEYKKAIAFAVMCRSMTRKVTMGHFAHTQAMSYAANPQRVRRNASLAKPLRQLFLEILPEYNGAVFDNGCMNKSLHGDAVQAVKDNPDVDVAYFDPPYCDSHPDYQGFYHLLETYVEYWKDRKFVNGTKRYEPRRPSGFERKATICETLRQLCINADAIPHWIFSYNDRSYPDVDTLTGILSEFRHVRVERKMYGQSRGGRGSVGGSSEILLIGDPLK